eukprot:scaffold3428_cov379-Prasinococcus_capsulatus_cf.AAC.13
MELHNEQSVLRCPSLDQESNPTSQGGLLVLIVRTTGSALKPRTNPRSCWMIITNGVLTSSRPAVSQQAQCIASRGLRLALHCVIYYFVQHHTTTQAHKHLAGLHGQSHGVLPVQGFQHPQTAMVRARDALPNQAGRPLPAP